MNFAGIDPSLNGTGIVILDEQEKVVDYLSFTTRTRKIDLHELCVNKEFNEDDEKNRSLKIAYSVQQLIEFLSIHQPQLICLEGYSFGSHSRSVTILAEFSGYLKICMLKHNFNFEVIPPTKIKKFITGKGNAGKDEVKEAVKKLNPAFLIQDNPNYKQFDLYDAFAISLFTKKLYKKELM